MKVRTFDITDISPFTAQYVSYKPAKSYSRGTKSRLLAVADDFVQLEVVTTDWHNTPEVR